MSNYRKLRATFNFLEWLDSQYMSIEALEDDLTVSFSQNTIYYSTDLTKTWTALSPNTTTPAINTGNRIYFKAEGLTPSASYGIGTFTTNKRCKACGNVMSLTDGYLSDCLFYKLFYNCTTLIEVSSSFLPATTLSEHCYLCMFQNCSSLTTAPELPATTLASYCYSSMFGGCTSLVTAPELPSTILAKGCYNSMFSGCVSFIKGPELPATTLENNCYYNMFHGCTSLVEAPKLPATTLADSCYTHMFNGCTSLTNVPSILPATTLASYCYEYMFQDCTSLIQIPALPATTLADNCYYGMFLHCTSLVEALELPATTLAPYCYYLMFANCTSLVEAPKLPATTLANHCYSNMFYGCSKLNFIYAKFTTTPSSSFTRNWVSDVASTGTFVKNYEATWNVTGTTGIPSGWTVEKDIRLDSCTNLYISADNVNGRATTTTIHYSATCTATTYEGNSIVVTLTETAISEEFPQNTSTTDTVERTITYEFMGQTATTTITQGVWVDQFYSLDLNSLWQSSTITNPDSLLYDGVYESFSNKGIDDSAAIAYITINSYSNFKFYVRSYGESNYDYVMVSLLDLTITYSTSYNSTDLVKAHTRSKSTSGTALSDYTLVEFTDIDGGEHTITVLYRKDGSGNDGDDKGYLLIPKNQ